MIADALFCFLSTSDIAEFIQSAELSVCYAAPGIQQNVAQAMTEVSQRIGTEMISVSLDFDERVMRMGYGAIEAAQHLRPAGIEIRNVAGLRTALVIVDDEGFVFTPTALYLEAEPSDTTAPNAMRMSREQVREALARLSPAARAIAVAQAKTVQERQRIEALPLDMNSELVSDEEFAAVGIELKEAPPVRFDLARQVRVFEPYLQYVELSLTGAAIQRHRLAIPQNIQKLGGSEDLERRLRTTFELIEKGSKLSSKPLEDALNEIRKNFTPSLGKDHGRIVLKAAKPHLIERLTKFREKLEKHQEDVAAKLQEHLDASRKQIVEYYLPRVVQTPPDALLGQSLSAKPSDDDARLWLDIELDRVFPKTESLVQEMKLDERFKDVTFETLNHPDFLRSVMSTFPNVNWDKPYSDFRAAGEGVR